jgi:hypothetical protein
VVGLPKTPQQPPSPDNSLSAGAAVQPVARGIDIITVAGGRIVALRTRLHRG